MLSDFTPRPHSHHSDGSRDPITSTADVLESCTCGLFGGETPFGPSDMVVPEELVRQLRELGGSPRAYAISTTWLVVKQMKAWLALPDSEFGELFNGEKLQAKELKEILAQGIGEVQARYHQDILLAIKDSISNDVNFICTVLAGDSGRVGVEREPKARSFLDEHDTLLSSFLLYARLVCGLCDDEMPARDKNELARAQDILARTRVELGSKALRSLERLGADIVSKFEQSEFFPSRQELPFADDYKLRSIIVFLRDLKEALGFLAEVMEKHEAGLRKP